MVDSLNMVLDRTSSRGKFLFIRFTCCACISIARLTFGDNVPQLRWISRSELASRSGSIWLAKAQQVQYRPQMTFGAYHDASTATVCTNLRVPLGLNHSRCVLGKVHGGIVVHHTSVLLQGILKSEQATAFLRPLGYTKHIYSAFTWVNSSFSNDPHADR